MRCYLGIDIGTYESKGVLVDGEGNIIASAAHPHRMQVPQAGWAEHNADEDWWGDFKRLSQKLIAEGKVAPQHIRAVGVSAIGPCMLPVDTDGNPLMNGVLYGVDTRAFQEIDDLTRSIGAATILAETGNALTPQSVGPKILWLKRNRPEIYKTAAKLVTSHSFITHKLTGRYVTDHYSASNWSPLYIPDITGWSMKLAPDICRDDQLADLAWSTDIIGEVTSWAGRETGLAPGTPVIAGTTDAAAEAVSVGVLSPRDMMIMYGSTIFIIMVAEKRVNDGRLWYAPWLFPGEHASMAGMPTCGTLTHWFRDTLAKDVAGKEGTIALAAEAAGSPPGANGIVMLPYFQGMLTPGHNPSAKGMVFGLNLTHTRGDIYRALLEGIAFGTNHIIETYVAADLAPRQVQAVGGGTHNTVWAQATSDVTGLRQHIRSKTIGASYGDAFLAALGVGDVTRDGIEAWNREDREIGPNPANRRAYEKQYHVFRELYERNKDLMALAPH